ncbi:hypothetical protein BKA61DRAFT_571879 [Leptodontidium sp. MPI-SDFR-AT-0119]|nr:hypothetical protein BKA61DRAFT_571879 [Leptodontidium sp. MPI-SDFR-AT-0119]
MSKSRAASDSGKATTRIQLYESDEQWANEKVDSHFPEHVGYADENEQERILREYMEEIEGRPAVDFDHRFNNGGMGGNCIGGVAHVRGLYPYSTSFPGLVQNLRAFAIPVAPKTLSSLHSPLPTAEKAIALPPNTPFVQPPTPIPIPDTSNTVPRELMTNTALVLGSQAEQNVMVPRAQRLTQSTSQAGRLDVTRKRVPEIDEMGQSKPMATRNAIDLTSSHPVNIAGTFPPVTHRPQSTSKSASPQRSKSTARYKETTHPGPTTPMEPTASSYSQSSVALESFVVPHGFGTTLPLGPDAGVGYPCGRPNLVSRKGFRDFELLKSYRNKMLEANVACKQNGVYFSADGQLHRALPTIGNSNSKTPESQESSTMGHEKAARSQTSSPGTTRLREAETRPFGTGEKDGSFKERYYGSLGDQASPPSVQDHPLQAPRKCHNVSLGPPFTLVNSQCHLESTIHKTSQFANVPENSIHTVTPSPSYFPPRTSRVSYSSPFLQPSRGTNTGTQNPLYNTRRISSSSETTSSSTSRESKAESRNPTLYEAPQQGFRPPSTMNDPRSATGTIHTPPLWSGYNVIGTSDQERGGRNGYQTYQYMYAGAMLQATDCGMREAGPKRKSSTRDEIGDGSHEEDMKQQRSAKRPRRHCPTD